MFTPEQSYAALPSKESTESGTPLLSDPIFLLSERRSKLRKWSHWIIHGISSVIIVGLFFGLHFAAQTSRVKCWDMFNYYCKISSSTR